MALLNKNHFISKFIFYFSLLYLCLASYGLFFSEKLIFLPQPPAYSFSNDLISIESRNSSQSTVNNTIVAQYFKNPNAKYTIIYSHGNSVDIGGLQHLQQNFYKHGYSIIIYDYSGYGHSEGEASEQQVYNDVQAVYNYLIEQADLKPEQIISYGHSLGAAIATELAFKNQVAGLALENPFTTAFRVKTIYPLVPFDKFSSIDKIDKINAPVFITHSKNDRVIPFWHSEELYKKAKTPKQSYWLETAGHSGITHTELFWPELNSFIESLK